MRRRQALLAALCLFAVALVPRVYVAWGDRSELLSDERTYDKYAWSFALDEPRVEKGKQIYHSLGSFTYRPPGYPLFLGLIYRLRGHSYRDARMVQAFLGAMTCTLVYLIGHQIFGFETGVLAGLLTATYGLLIQFARLVLSETLFVFLICGFALLLLTGIRRKAPSTAFFFAAGILLGLSAITRPVGLPIGLLTFLFFPVGLKAEHGRLKAGLAFALGLLLVVGAVTIRNYQMQGALIPISTHGGITFWRGVLKGGADYPPELVSLRERIGDLPELEQQRLYYEAAIEFLRYHPEAIPGILLEKVKLLLVYTTYTVAHKRLTVAMDPYFWYCVSGFGVLGMLIQPRRLRLEKAFLAMMIFVQIAATLVYDSSVRYRIPLIPFLALLAAHALVTTVQWIAGVVMRDGTTWLRRPPSGGTGAESIVRCKTQHEKS